MYFVLVCSACLELLPRLWAERAAWHCLLPIHAKLTETSQKLFTGQNFSFYMIDLSFFSSSDWRCFIAFQSYFFANTSGLPILGAKSELERRRTVKFRIGLDNKVSNIICPDQIPSSDVSTPKGLTQYVYIIDQAWGQDGRILAEFSFCVFMDLDFVSVHKNAKRERGQYPAILAELRSLWS